MDRGECATWRARVQADLDRLSAHFEQTYGFPPGAHTLGPPSSPAELAALDALTPTASTQLRDLYRGLGPVCLPDVGNGYFVHPAVQVVEHARTRELHRVAPPTAAT